MIDSSIFGQNGQDIIYRSTPNHRGYLQHLSGWSHGRKASLPALCIIPNLYEARNRHLLWHGVAGHGKYVLLMSTGAQSCGRRALGIAPQFATHVCRQRKSAHLQAQRRERLEVSLCRVFKWRRRGNSGAWSWKGDFLLPDMGPVLGLKYPVPFPTESGSWSCGSSCLG